MTGIASQTLAVSCFQTSIIGNALSALKAIVPVTGSHAKTPRSPETLRRICFTPPTQAPTMAGAGLDPLIPTWTHPDAGQNALGGTVIGRAGAALALTVAVQPLRVMTPAVIPSLNGRYYIEGLRKDTRVLFTHDDFTKPPGPTTPFEDYDVFVAPRSVVDANAPGLRAFLAAYHGKSVPYLLDPATQSEAIAEITRYVNAEQKSPIDEKAMRQQLLTSRFFDLAKVREIVASPGFRAGLGDQVRFLLETKQIAAPIPLDAVVVTDLLTG